MQAKVLVVSATQIESEILKDIDGIDLISIVTGVGAVATAWALTRYLNSEQRPDLAVNIGIAGSYKNDIRKGDVVIPVSDCFADAGIEERTGFLTLAEAGLQKPDEFPYRAGRLVAENSLVSAAPSSLRRVNAVTVGTATGSRGTINRISAKYNPDIETMEGAAFFFVCCMEKIPFIALRAISNMVEPRNRGNWDIPLALKNLTARLREVLLLID